MFIYKCYVKVYMYLLIVQYEIEYLNVSVYMYFTKSVS